MTKEETKTLAVVVERLDGLKEDTQEIKTHLATLNGKVASQELAIEKTREIAAKAENRAEYATACAKEATLAAASATSWRDKAVNKVLAWLVVFLSGAVITLVAAVIQSMG